ncbi:MAG: SIR2 family protein [Bryobacterales bacterium]|nr:SIR2 family protein [Bryobacterales bacterium]
MPKLIPDGPDIPGELIQKQEAGEMVFFCGAGVSVPTGLPSLPELVQQIYPSLNISPTSGEEKLRKQEKFDEVLDLLERRLSGDAMRSEVVRLLSVAPKPSSLRLHRSLLRVSHSPSGMHLVTTNYDDNFAHASCSEDLRFDVGPTLPDLDDWNSVVHLHGRIQASEGEPVVPPLVLTDTDFGTAYIHGRWAAEFVSKLMDRYTVVFVGYSMADVVLRRLTKAFTRRRVHHRNYSLVGYKDEKQREQRELEWNEIGIDPILYHSGNEHELLNRTVEEWAELAADPHQYRVRLALSGLKRAPDRQTHEADPDRVVWALSEPAAAWPTFNRIRRTPVLGAHAAGWLHEFAIRGLMGGTIHPKPHERGPAGPVVTVRAEQQMLQTDSVANAVAQWIEIHAHAPEIFQWVINHGHNIGFELRRRLWDRLVSAENDLPDIPPRLARLWALLLAEPAEDAEFLLCLDQILNKLSRDNAEARDDVLLRLLRPRLGVFRGPPPYRIHSTDASTPEQVALLSCGHTEVILGCRDEQSSRVIPETASHTRRRDERSRFSVLLEIEPRRFQPFLRRHAVTLTDYLKTAFELLPCSDQADIPFIRSQLLDALVRDDLGARWTASPTADPKPTNSQRRGFLRDACGTWTVLLDWVRASYTALPNDSSERADLLRCWINSNEKMLWCLALRAIEKDSAADFDMVRLILLRNAQEVLWDPDCLQEVLAVLRQVGTRGSLGLQAELMDTVQSRADSGTPQPDYDGNILAEVGPLLAALNEGGVILSPTAAQTLAAFERRQNAALRRETDASPVAPSGRIREVVAMLQGGSVDVARFRQFARQRPVAAMLALQELGRGGNWPAEMWKVALDAVQTKIKDARPGHQRCAALSEILLGIPGDLFQYLQSDVARLVDILVERWSTADESGFWRLWTRGWEHRSQQSRILSPSDALAYALNTTAGTYAGAAMKRIRDVTTTTSSPITTEQISILDRIVGDNSGSAGIVIVVYWIDWLYGNVNDWTTRNVIPRMRWRTATPLDELNEQVRDLWGVVAFRFRGPVSPGLVRALGSDLWAAVQKHKEIDRGDELIRFFVYASISGETDLIDESTCRETAHIVIRDNPLPVGDALRRVLDGDDQPREQVWNEFVRRWLDRYWPREKSLNTPQSSSALVQVIMATGDAFPDAVDWANGYLLALDDRQIGRVWYHKSTWISHPQATVALLHRIVPEVDIEPWARAPLGDMLKTLREVDATIPQDSRFLELEQRAAR